MDGTTESESREHGAESRTGLKVGDERTVVIGPVAHGGHFVAHSDGRTLFVRHALAGERARVRVTSANSKVVRADAVEILEASPDRVEPPCAWSSSCGGCDFQHVSLDAQRRLKTEILRDALRRFGGMPEDFGGLRVEVEPLPDCDDGLHWRTRMRWGVRPDGALGLRRQRSHSLVPVDTCLLAAEGIDRPDLQDMVIRGVGEVIAARGSDGRVSVVIDGKPVPGPGRVRQVVDGREWRIKASGFWQVHPSAAASLSAEVLAQGNPQPGQSWWDLYAGSGLFAAGFGAAVSEAGRVDAVEASVDAVAEARRALHDLPQVKLQNSDVGTWLAAASGTPDGVVLDPPRSGAGADVVNAIAATGAPTVVYVACDPVALGRDVALFAAHGYRVTALRSFDAFPMTHHLETVAALHRA